MKLGDFMGALRRAYRGWFLKRLVWLIPGFTVCCVIGGRVLLESAGSPASIPSLAIVAGSLLLFGTMFFRCVQVYRRGSRGDRSGARTLRRVLGPYRELSMAGIAAVLSLAALPLLFERPHPLRELAVHHPSHGRPGAKQSSDASPIDAAPISTPAAPAATEPTPAPPELPPRPLPLPELPKLEDDPFLTPLPLPLTVPTTLAQDAPTRGREDQDPPQRPEVVDFIRTLAVKESEHVLDRGGLPYEGDATSMPLPELSLDITLVPNSGKWKGSIYELSFDLPLNQNESLRMTYFAAAMNNEKDDDAYEATLAWQRMTLSYEHKLAGYTRHATFDLAVRLGGTVDVISEHESGIRVNPTPRVSPWVGVEAAVWEQSGLGVIVQGGYSVAARVTGASSSVADLRLLIRYDLSETLSVYLGYRYTTVRLHDHDEGPLREELHEHFSGPLAGLSLRF
ncbi:MAG TPA: hypothetical protein VNM14_10455 [Planctomycetota bacterium]|nr:hypothetical protein [Planctomycetota bacterium]